MCGTDKTHARTHQVPEHDGVVMLEVGVAVVLVVQRERAQRRARVLQLVVDGAGV